MNNITLSIVMFLCLSLAYRFGIIEGLRSSSQIFSKSIDGLKQATLRTFPGVSITTCERECQRRAQCQGVIYRRLATLCTLTAVPQSRQTFIDKPGHTLVTGFDHTSETGQACGEIVCGQTQTCVAVDTCKITECRPPDLYPCFHGNMFAVDSVLRLFSGITCGSDGTWTSADDVADVTATGSSLELHNVKKFGESCYYSDNEYRAYSQSKELCVQIAPTAHIVDINSLEEDTFIKHWVQERKRDVSPPMFWLGARLDPTSMTYRWSDGTSLATGNTYISWNQGEPNGFDECVLAWEYMGYRWTDVPCSIVYPAITVCEFTMS